MSNHCTNWLAESFANKDTASYSPPNRTGHGQTIPPVRRAKPPLTALTTHRRQKLAANHTTVQGYEERGKVAENRR